MRQLGRLHIKEQHLNLWFQMLKEETSATFDQLNNAVSLLSNNTTDTDVHRVLKNLSNSTLSFMYPNDLLKPPTVYHFLPHLLSNFSSLLPAYRWSRNRFGSKKFYVDAIIFLFHSFVCFPNFIYSIWSVCNYISFFKSCSTT